MTDLSDISRRLEDHRHEIERTPMRTLFAADGERFRRFSLTLDDLLFDFSKNRITAQTLALLAELADRAGVEARRDRMFDGEPVNATERRAALHMALRAAPDAGFRVAGRDVMADVHDQLRRMAEFSRAVRAGTLTGATGRPFTDVVNLGVGGSDLGPAMAAAALRPWLEGPRLHFVANMDGADIADALARLDPATTLFLVASKSFTTDETMTNAATARRWLTAALGSEAVAAHFAAISTNAEAVAAFGIREDFRFWFWDWVGGRYSVWSAIGLPLCLAAGFDRFAEFLAGGAAADAHFRSAPLAANIPVVMALLGVWYRNFWGFPTHAVIPYDNRLKRLPAYLQQLDMESNGKRVRADGTPVDRATGPVIWGEPGTNCQHAFLQLIHQGTDVVPVDFLIAANAHDDLPGHHAKLVANCLAQSEALMRGKDEDEVRRELAAAGLAEDEIAWLAPHKVMPGNRPSNTILYRQLDPRTLGMLIALYEHKVFVQGTIWGINSFDQWGVEFGKTLAHELLPLVERETSPVSRDASTLGLLENFLEKTR